MFTSTEEQDIDRILHSYFPEEDLAIAKIHPHNNANSLIEIAEKEVNLARENYESALQERVF